MTSETKIDSVLRVVVARLNALNRVLLNRDNLAVSEAALQLGKEVERLADEIAFAEWYAGTE